MAEQKKKKKEHQRKNYSHPELNCSSSFVFRVLKEEATLNHLLLAPKDELSPKIRKGHLQMIWAPFPP